MGKELKVTFTNEKFVESKKLEEKLIALEEEFA